MRDTELLGRRIGRILITEFIARGGMGAIYVGVDEVLERRVALKVIKAHRRLDPKAKSRFLREARVLSRLQHPNISLIHDYVEGEEMDVLVLELIQGRGLKKALQDGFSEPLKMKAAEQIADVLKTAHEKGIVHRDLKPGNIMITEDNEVKVLDFGISRFVDLDHELQKGLQGGGFDTDGKIRSNGGSDPGDGHPLSDEERELAETVRIPGKSGTDDRSSDVETRVGSVVGTLSSMSPEQARGEPVGPASDIYSFGLLLQEMFSERLPYEQGLTPTTQLYRAAGGKTLPVEGIDPDLITLINRMKSLAPGARPSAADTLERLCWIQNKPRRRFRRIVAVTAVVLLALFSAVTAFQAWRIHLSAERATQEAAAAREVTDFMVGLFEVSDPGENRGNTITAREILDRGAERIKSELSGQPLTMARLLDTMGQVYMALGLYDQALPLLQQAVGIRRAELDSQHPDLAQSLHSQGTLHHHRNELDQAEPLYLEALEIREAGLGGNHIDVGRSLNHLASLYRGKGFYRQAEPLFERSLAIVEQTLGPDHPEVGTILNNLAALYRIRGDYGKAEPLYRRDLEICEKSLGPDHPDVATSLNNLGTLYRNTGQYDRSEPLLLRSLAIDEAVLGEDHPGVAIPLCNLGILRREQGDLQEAENLFRRALDIFITTFGSDNRRVLQAETMLAGALTDQKKFQEARQLFAQALEKGRVLQRKAPDSPRVQGMVAEILIGFGLLQQALGDQDTAQRHWEEALEIIIPVAEHSEAVKYLDLHARLLLLLDRVEEARPLVEVLASRQWAGSEFKRLCRIHGLSGR